MGHEEFMSQEEVDALLKGVTGEVDTDTEQSDRRAYARTTSRRRNASSAAACPDLEIINDRFARLLRVGIFNFMRRSAEISVGPVKVSEVQRIHPQPADPDQPEPGPREAVARHVAVRVRSEPGVLRGRQPVRRRRPLPHPRRRPRLHADRAAHHQQAAQSRVRALHGVVEAACARSSSNTCARKCTRSSPTSRRPTRS